MKSLFRLIAAGFVIATPLTAQTGVVTFEGGMRSDAHLNGTTLTKPFGGIGFAATMDGSADKGGAILLIGSFEMRMAPGTITDLNGFADLAIRAGNLAFGGSLSGQYDYHEEVRDATLGGSDGFVTTTYPISLGYGGFAKLNFGTNSRTFIQGRYSLMPASLARPFGDQSQSTVPTVPMLDSHVYRVALGQTFDKWIIRAQLIQEAWRFERKDNNSTGAYDRDSQIISLGFSRIF